MLPSLIRIKMTSTYCDKTEEGRYVLYMTQDELGLIADLLNSVNDPRAVPLRRAVDNEIRAQNTFKILRQTEIVQCDYCKGTGHVLYYNEFEQKYNDKKCPKCEGKCQKVAITITRFEEFTPYWINELTPRF